MSPQHRPFSIFRGLYAPVAANQQLLGDAGLKVRYFSSLSTKVLECDALIVSSRFFHRAGEPSSIEGRVRAVEKLAQAGPKLIWFDERDSAGTTQFEVLPYVARYLKKQLYRDRGAYRKNLYGNRLYTDYYHREFGINDSYEEEQHSLPLDGDSKLAVAWNIGLERIDLRRENHWKSLAAAAGSYLRRAAGLNPYVNDWGGPKDARSNSICALFGTKYDRETIAWQRIRALEILHKSKFPNAIIGQRLSPAAYRGALTSSKIVLSCFGWGEVCYREWEAAMAGAAIIMPDMNGIETWPDLYQANKTYWPVRWDLGDLSEAVSTLLADHKTRHGIASTAQDLYRSQFTQAGREAFAVRFSELVTV